jgi:flagellar biosynthetic protein FlhB
MAEEQQGERTEEATQQRREEFRRRGQVAQTRELASVFMLFGSVLAIWLLGRFFGQQLVEVFTRSYSEYFVAAARDGDWLAAGRYALEKIALLVIPMSALLWCMSFASTVAQIGFLYNEDALELDFDRLNPFEGLKKLITVRALIEGGKALLKLITITAIVVVVMHSEIVKLPHLISFSVSQLLGYISTVTLKLLTSVGTFMGVLAGADYFYQRWDLEQRMRMTKQEVKEEHKSREGDPLIKARIRRLQRELSSKRMMNDVPKADVIVTNPTHIAIAIKYDESMVAPKVLAKGAGLIAEKIRELARQHRIPIVENKPLARTIFKTIKIGHAIPRELYTAVAEVLSYVYKLKKRGVH